MSERTAWVHPNPVMGGFVVLPDGFEMRRNVAEAKGYTISAWPKDQRTAMKHPHAAGSVVLPRGTVISAETAKSAGFVVGADTMPNPERSKRSEIMRLPEANARPSATAELLTSHPSLSVEVARAFLRGLPTEETETKETTTMTTTTDPRAARLAEIQGSMSAFNKSRGHAAKPTQGAVDPSKLRRLAEIKLNAMQMNGQANTQEAKILKLALDTNATTGAPLEQSLAQLGFDAATLFVTRR